MLAPRTFRKERAVMRGLGEREGKEEEALDLEWEEEDSKATSDVAASRDILRGCFYLEFFN